MISDKNKDRVSLICHATAGNLFSLFCNPSNRGPNFEWSNFPDIAAHHCKTQVIISDIRSRHMKELYAHAEQTGKVIAEKMVKQAGFN